MKPLFPLLIILFLLTSCSGRKVFEQRHTFDDLRWNRFKSVFFEFDITDTKSLYDLSLMLRHHTVYAEPDLQMTIAIYTPSGERRLKDVILQVRNADGTFKGSGMGDLWDIEQVVFQGYTFNEQGHYKIEIENRMAKLDTPGMMELGLRVEKVK